MAARKPLFMSSEGYSEEMALTDSMTLGALSIDSSGTGIDMNGKKVYDMGAATTSGDALAYGQSNASLAGLNLTGNLVMNNNKITGLATGTSAQDAVTKAQLDAAVISGGVVKELLFDQAQLSNAQGIKALEVLTFEAQPVAGDTITVTDGTVTVTMTAVANQGAESADTDFSIESSAATAMQRFVTRFNAAAGNTIWDATWRATEHPDINAAGIIVLTEKVTAAGNSTSRVYGTWGTQANAHVVEFASGGVVNLDYSNEVEVNLPAADPAEGRFGLRRQQSALVAGELHFVRSNDSTYSWDDDTNVWQIMNGPESIPDATAASGGGIKGKITVDSDKGLAVASGVLSVKVETDGAITFDSTNKGLQVNLEASSPSLQIVTNELGVKLGDGLDKDANGLTIDLEASNPTLQLSGTSPNKELGVKYDNTKGLDTSSGGMTVKVDGSTISFNGSGQLQAIGSDEATRVENTLNTATDATANGDPVYINGNSTLGKADAGTDAKARVTGIIRTGGGAAGSAVQIVSAGPCAGILSGATFNTPYYLQDGGGMGTTPPGAGKRVIRLGFALNGTDFFVAIADYGKKAA